MIKGQPMKSIRTAASTLVLLMILSIFSSMVAIDSPSENTQLSEEVNQNYAVSPGHAVFAEYMGAYWCPPCTTTSSNLANLIDTNGGRGGDFTYISFWESQSTGWPSDAPINRDEHIRTAPGYGGGIPVTTFGDADSGNYYTSGGQNYDSYYTSGGGMDASAAQFDLEVAQYANGNDMEIEITAVYNGAGTKTVWLYAAVAEDTSPETYTVNGNPNPHHVWKKWLLNGAASGFESFTLSSGTPVSHTWTVPISTVRAGGGHSAEDNFLTIATLQDGDHSGYRNVYTAADSSMVPLIDVGISEIVFDNPSADKGYVTNDVINVQATVVNNGLNAYSDGGSAQFYYIDGTTEVEFGSPITLNNFPNSGSSQQISAQLDTSSVPVTNWDTTIKVRLTGLVKDMISLNNVKSDSMLYDNAPISKEPQVTGDLEIDRGVDFYVEARAQITDGVDLDLSTITFDIEISPTGQNLWDSQYSSPNGDLMFPGETNEYRSFLIQPDIMLSSGDYDLRSKAMDGRGQESPWVVNDEAFAIMNSFPLVSQDPITVKVQTSRKVSMSEHISDAESPGDISGLTVSSTHDAFVGWYPDTEEIEVYFDSIQMIDGEPIQTGIEISVFDGEDTSYSTLLFNIIENGQPRWDTINRLFVDEGSSGQLNLENYLSDTDQDGNSISASGLTLALIENSDDSVMTASLEGFMLSYQTSLIDIDVNGYSTFTIRASDGLQSADQTITVEITPVNDAPRVDLTGLTMMVLQVGQEKTINFDEIISDVDGDIESVFVRASTDDVTALTYTNIGHIMTLKWNEKGIKTVTVEIDDFGLNGKNVYTFEVEVIDHRALTVSKEDGSMVKLSINDYLVGDELELMLALSEDGATFISIESSWQLCNADTETCRLYNVVEHEMKDKASGWTFSPFEGMEGGELRFHDQIKLGKVSAVDSEGIEWQSSEYVEWYVEEHPMSYAEMSAEEFAAKLAALQAELDALKESDASEVEIAKAEADIIEACQTGMCGDSVASGTESGLAADGDLTLLLGIIGLVLIFGLLGGLLFMRGNKPEIVGEDWNQAVPATDMVANSMYGGAEQLFQQQYAQPPVAQPIVTLAVPTQPGMPPLPASGLPAGWTMEQWSHYGHTYLEQTGQ
jgi:hypothetical protein